ncbi:MAG: SpoIIE family protein phosphatase [Bacteroidota bacterium]
MRIKILFVTFLLILIGPAFSTDITIDGTRFTINDKEKNTVDLNENWRFAVGDNLAWANPKFDDQKWDTAYFPITIEALLPFHYKGNIWFRSTFKITEKEILKSLSFLVKQFGASEIYIDGKLIHQFGTVGTSLATEEAFNPQNIPASFIMDSLGTHTIAIRYSNHLILNEDDPGSNLNCFDLHITSTEEAILVYKFKEFKESILTAIGIGGFLSLSLMNFILFLFYKREKANLFYSLFSACVAISFIIQTTEYNSGSVSVVVILNQLHTAFVFLSNFFLVVLVYSFIYDKNPKRLWIILGLTILGLILIPLAFDIADSLSVILNLYCVIEIIVIVLKAYGKKYDPTKKKRKRLWIILASLGAMACLGLLIHKMISIVIFIILVLIFVLPVAGLIFIVPVYMTIRHARSFAVTNESLEDQLIQVKALSAKAIEQEQEKKKILETQNERLEHMVTERTSELAQKNNEIKDSINYAQRIQNAILTSKEEINETLKQCFVLFKPKDIVSGDFYFYVKKEQKVLIAAADCTGHGVPGALMSMIGTEKLIGAALESTQPSMILNFLNKGIKTSLRQSDQEGSTRDGMDIALTAIDLETNKVIYAGANRPIWIIRNGTKEVEEIKATKKAIGGFTPDDQHFDSHEINLNKGDTYYLFTDGYADQFGNGGKKLMTKKFRELLVEIQSHSMDQQEIYLNDFIENWKKGVEQIDDILVIGVRI